MRKREPVMNAVTNDRKRSKIMVGVPYKLPSREKKSCKTPIKSPRVSPRSHMRPKTMATTLKNRLKACFVTNYVFKFQM